jgi:hypothetical protein
MQGVHDRASISSAGHFADDFQRRVTSGCNSNGKISANVDALVGKEASQRIY